MQKVPSITDKGFSLVEVMLSSALFVLLVTTLIGAYLYGEESTKLAGDRVRAVLFAEEGLEAARNIRDSAFTGLTVGIFGLSTTSNQWNFSGASDTNDIFTRVVTVGSIDARRKVATSTVTWQQNAGRAGTVVLVSRFTDWLRSAATDAEKLIVNMFAGHLNPGDNTQITGITLANPDSANITVTTMSVSWSGAPGGNKIRGITIGGISVWSGNSGSRSVENITDVVLSGGIASTTPINILDFSKNMTGATIHITFTMGDGSSTTTPNITL